jgi:hypothetical protein
MQNAGNTFEQGVRRVSVQKGSIWLLEEFCEGFESKGGSELFGLSA